MSNTESVNGQDDVQDRKQKKHDSGAADLERVTDWTEESEISKDISNAVNLFADKRNKEHEEKLAKEHELQKIQVKKEHLELVMTELEVSTTTGEKALRESKGDVVLALKNLIKVAEKVIDLDLERVTDWTEESEISKDISNAVNLFADKRNKEHEEKLAKEHELQKIQVKKEHLELIMTELEVSATTAEKALRENKGDVKIQVKKEHLELIMTELEVSTTTGEKALRESKGDVVLALKNLIKVAERVIDLDLERVTDWTEESEISKDISNAVNLFADKRNKEHEEKLAKEHELQKIQVKKEHLELVMTELEVSATTVEKALRENKGDVVLALTNLIEEANFKKAFNLTLSNLMKQNIVVLPTKNDESF
ncbi:CLUMA_CG020106, isoform A [Clunio marinus]|uniref:CLUMA_CG020106, isoform A n=1 Tax=Clunio marinus TaxID=568069 RepID=A0A1J1J3V2_9DIPT|nr:CLUMA_CG020106, isoform A [Clunio marinus]